MRRLKKGGACEAGGQSSVRPRPKKVKKWMRCFIVLGIAEFSLVGILTLFYVSLFLCNKLVSPGDNFSCHFFGQIETMGKRTELKLEKKIELFKKLDQGSAVPKQSLLGSSTCRKEL